MIQISVIIGYSQITIHLRLALLLFSLSNNNQFTPLLTFLVFITTIDLVGIYFRYIHKLKTQKKKTQQNHESQQECSQQNHESQQECSQQHHESQQECSQQVQNEIQLQVQRSSSNQQRGNENSDMYGNCYLALIIEHIVLIGLLVVLILYCPKLDSPYLNQLIIMLMVFYLIKYLTTNTNRWILKFFSLIRFSAYLQLLFLNLCINQIIQCSFAESFWIYWILFCIQIGILLGYKIILVAKLIQFYKKQIENYRIIGTIWMWYILMGLAFNPFLTVIQIINHFESKVKTQNTTDYHISTLVIYLSIYSLILLIINLCFNHQIYIYCINLEKDELQQEPGQVQDIDSQEQKIEKIDASKLFSPFLARFSTTYYKTVNASFVMNREENEKDKQIDGNNKIINESAVLKNNPIFTVQDENVSFNAQSQSYQPDQCLICYDNKPDAVNMDCGHGGICYDCGKDVLHKTGECYLCRDKIKLLYKIEGKHGKVVQVKEAIRIK